MPEAVDPVLAAIRDKQRIGIFGDYDCDGILGTHMLRAVLAGLGVPAWAYLPHRDEGQGLTSCAVHNLAAIALALGLIGLYGIFRTP